ncbi:unnamed protein product [Prorocentrum cordatum]|uniref:Phospholipase B-like n=1 Tax=Prorocentrum cordatum TaxID=2364126 RepID=A0ABN9URA7_9DINO|nr:unnamed protein product [Polarella glacialis]
MPLGGARSLPALPGCGSADGAPEAGATPAAAARRSAASVPLLPSIGGGRGPGAEKRQRHWEQMATTDATGWRPEMARAPLSRRCDIATNVFLRFGSATVRTDAPFRGARPAPERRSPVEVPVKRLDGTVDAKPVPSWRFHNVKYQAGHYDGAAAKGPLLNVAGPAAPLSRRSAASGRTAGSTARCGGPRTLPEPRAGGAEAEPGAPVAASPDAAVGDAASGIRLVWLPLGGGLADTQAGEVWRSGGYVGAEPLQVPQGVLHPWPWLDL